MCDFFPYNSVSTSSSFLSDGSKQSSHFQTSFRPFCSLPRCWWGGFLILGWCLACFSLRSLSRESQGTWFQVVARVPGFVCQRSHYCIGLLSSHQFPLRHPQAIAALLSSLLYLLQWAGHRNICLSSQATVSLRPSAPSAHKICTLPSPPHSCPEHFAWLLYSRWQVEHR